MYVAQSSFTDKTMIYNARAPKPAYLASDTYFCIKFEALFDSGVKRNAQNRCLHQNQSFAVCHVPLNLVISNQKDNVQCGEWRHQIQKQSVFLLSLESHFPLFVNSQEWTQLTTVSTASSGAWLYEERIWGQKPCVRLHNKYPKSCLLWQKEFYVTSQHSETTTRRIGCLCVETEGHEGPDYFEQSPGDAGDWSRINLHDCGRVVRNHFAQCDRKSQPDFLWAKQCWYDLQSSSYGQIHLKALITKLGDSVVEIPQIWIVLKHFFLHSEFTFLQNALADTFEEPRCHWRANMSVKDGQKLWKTDTCKRFLAWLWQGNGGAIVFYRSKDQKEVGDISLPQRLSLGGKTMALHLRQIDFCSSQTPVISDTPRVLLTVKNQDWCQANQNFVASEENRSPQEDIPISIIVGCIMWRIKHQSCQPRQRHLLKTSARQKHRKKDKWFHCLPHCATDVKRVLVTNFSSSHRRDLSFRGNPQYLIHSEGPGLLHAHPQTAQPDHSDWNTDANSWLCLCAFMWRESCLLRVVPWVESWNLRQRLMSTRHQCGCELIELTCRAS